MGTSSNHPSPKTPNWNLVRASIGAKSLGADKQSREIWRAAAADKGNSLAEALGSPLLARASLLAEKCITPSLAVRAFEDNLLSTHASSLFFDLGKRALARSVSDKTGRVGFAGELFAETAGYYVSRDLPSFIGNPGKLDNVGQAIKLKVQIGDYTKTVAKMLEVKSDPKGWRAYVEKVLHLLQEGNKK